MTLEGAPAALTREAIHHAYFWGLRRDDDGDRDHHPGRAARRACMRSSPPGCR